MGAEKRRRRDVMLDRTKAGHLSEEGMGQANVVETIPGSRAMGKGKHRTGNYWGKEMLSRALHLRGRNYVQSPAKRRGRLSRRFPLNCSEWRNLSLGLTP